MVKSLSEDCKKKGKESVNVGAIQSLVDVLNKNDLAELHYEWDNIKIKLTRFTQQGYVPTYQSSGAAAPHSPAVLIDSHKAEGVLGSPILSPMVGTAYLSPKPGAEPFVRVGDYVQKDQVLLIIEAMKVMNTIKATSSGRISSITAVNGAPVEYGEELMRIVEN